MRFFDDTFQYFCRKCCFRHPEMGWIVKAVAYIDCNGKRLKVDAIGSSTVSHEDAKNIAQSLVDEKVEHLFETICIPPPIVYTSSQDVQVECPEDKCGDPVTATGTRTSTISQEDADNLAIADATAKATALLVCNDRIPAPTNLIIHSDPSGDWSITWDNPVLMPNGIHYVFEDPEGNTTEGDTTDEIFSGHLNGGNRTTTLTLTTNGDETNCASLPISVTGTVQGESGDMLYQSVQTVTVQCPFGTSGAEKTATRAAESLVSQLDADNLATAAATAAATALLDCTTIPIYTSTQTVTLFCPDGKVGDSVEATETRESDVDQADADALALAAATAAATALLNCVDVIYTSTQCYTAACPEDAASGGPLTDCETATSIISQADADTIALAAATAAANAGLVCTWEGTATYTANCVAPQHGESVTRTAHAYSLISQADADANALATATTAAEAVLYCTDEVQYCSDQSFIAACDAGFHGDSVTRYCHYCSIIDQADADTQASACAQARAEADLICEPD